MSQTDTPAKAPGASAPGIGLAPATSPPVPAKVSSPDQPQKLDDVLLAMDVVDTIRHREQMADAELNAEQREQDLIDRLKEIYSAQGMDVPDRILKEGVKALDEHRFAYAPADPGKLSTKLAKAYISRGRWLPQTLTVVILLVAAVAAWQAFYVMPQAKSWRELPAEITRLSTEGQALAVDTAVDVRIARLADSAMTAYRQNDQVTAKGNVAELKKLDARLAAEYDVRVVNRGDESSGVLRYHDDANGRSYYLIVEAITSGGKALKLPITSEETQTTTTVEKWGQRVPKETFDKIAAEKADNHIIESAVIGHKSRGELDPKWTQDVLPGAITEW